MAKTIDRVCMLCQSPITITVDPENETVDGGRFVFMAPEDIEEDWMEPNQHENGEIEMWECPDCYEDIAQEHEDDPADS